jgi:ribosomal protein S18 acetylase RimI-like enzyme
MTPNRAGHKTAGSNCTSSPNPEIGTKGVATTTRSNQQTPRRRDEREIVLHLARRAFGQLSRVRRSDRPIVRIESSQSVNVNGEHPMHEDHIFSMPMLILRQATSQDKEFAFQTKKAALGEYVAQTRGWDEDEQRLFHERRFETQDFQIVRFGMVDAGVLSVDRQPDCITVNQLYILPAHQNLGIGSICMATIFDEAAAAGVPVRLQVLKVNSRALAFYERLHFRKIGECDTHIFMEWRAPTDTREY